MSNFPPKLLQSLSNWTLCITLLTLVAGCSDAEPPQTQAVSSPSSTTSATLSPQSDAFKQAIDTAISASNLTQSAVSQDDWKVVTSQWQKAITLLKSVPASHPKKQLATEKIALYQQALAYAQQQAAKPQRPKSVSAKVTSTPSTPKQTNKPLQIEGYSNFSQWCVNKKHISKQAQHTVKILLKRVETQNCLVAEEKLAKLNQLILPNRKITDISPLSGLTNLTILVLYYNEIKDISPLSGLPNLTQLWLNNNEIKDVSPLSGLTNLHHLTLDDNEIKDISSLSGLTNLTVLTLDNNQITNINSISGLTKLTGLNLNNNQIKDISPLSELTNLLSLGIYENQITNISPLSGLTNLSSLFIHENQITDINPLSGLTNLKYLSLYSNQITDFSPLSRLTNLTDLWLGNNPIANPTCPVQPESICKSEE